MDKVAKPRLTEERYVLVGRKVIESTTTISAKYREFLFEIPN